MPRHRHDLSWQVCHEADCPMYMVKGGGNIKVHSHYGVGGDIHELRCTACGKLFSENKGTPYFDMRTPREKIMLILKLLVEGNGIRGTSRITGVHRDTVTRILERTASHLENVSDVFLAGLSASEIQFDGKGDLKVTEVMRFEGWKTNGPPMYGFGQTAPFLTHTSVSAGYKCT